MCPLCPACPGQRAGLRATRVRPSNELGSDPMSQRTSSVICAALLAGCSVAGPVDTGKTPLREVSDSRFDSYLQEMTAKQHFTGVVLIMREGKILHSKGY